jgi:hypothetical protein
LENKYNTPVVDLMPRYQKVTIGAEDDAEDAAEIYLSNQVNMHDVLKDTLDAIRQQKRILYQPTFQIGDCLVRGDFMVWNGD